MNELDLAVLRDAIETAREAEKRQALTYRRLASAAENGQDEELAQRFHDLHADEQHHLSRLTARLLELGGRPADLSEIRADPIPLGSWRAGVQAAEELEVEQYEALLEQPLDDATRTLIEEILTVERQHASELGGKWTMA